MNLARELPGATHQKSFEKQEMIATQSLREMNNIKTMIIAGITVEHQGKENSVQIQAKDPAQLCQGWPWRSQGFVGLTPQEFFFHAMGGTEGDIHTAAMEDVMVHYNGNVRNSLGEIVQSLYREDSFDAISVEKQKLVSMKISTMVMEKNYRWFPKQQGFEPPLCASTTQLSGFALNQNLTAVQPSSVPLQHQMTRPIPSPRQLRQSNSHQMLLSQGFVGLTPQEFFFHAMGGTEGDIHTADVMVHYNGNVRNSLGEIVQSLYGEDSFDAISVEKQKLVSMKISTMVMEKNYRWFPKQQGFGEGVLQPEIIRHQRRRTDQSHPCAQVQPNCLDLPSTKISLLHQMLLYKLIQQMRGPILTCHTAAAKLIRLYCKKTEEDFMPELPALMNHLMGYQLEWKNLTISPTLSFSQANPILTERPSSPYNIPLQQGCRAELSLDSELRSQPKPREPFWVILQPPALSLWKKDHSTISTFMKGLAPHLVQFLHKVDAPIALHPRPPKPIEPIRTGHLLGYLSFSVSILKQIPRYVMLLTDLDKNTPNYHIDKDNLSEALEKVKGVASFINDKKEAKYFNILILLYNQSEPKVEDLCEAHQRLICFSLAKYTGEIHQLYLMNDMLLITQEKSNQRLRLVEKININNYAQIRIDNSFDSNWEQTRHLLSTVLKNIDKVPDPPNTELLSKLQLSLRGVQKERRHSINASHTDVCGKTGSFCHSMDSTFFGLPLPSLTNITSPPWVSTAQSNYAAINHIMASTVLPTAFLQAG
ncbi:hypothetical protein PROFUN_16657, partial [Planoprotostelium fungivorum]